MLFSMEIVLSFFFFFASYIFQITCYYTVIRIFGIRETFVLRCFKVDVIPFHVRAFNVLKT